LFLVDKLVRSLIDCEVLLNRHSIGALDLAGWRHASVLQNAGLDDWRKMDRSLALVLFEAGLVHHLHRVLLVIAQATGH